MHCSGGGGSCLAVQVIWLLAKADRTHPFRFYRSTSHSRDGNIKLSIPDSKLITFPGSWEVFDRTTLQNLRSRLVLSNDKVCDEEMSNRYYEYEKPARGSAKKLKELLLKSDNRNCADCGAPDPKWASANIGVFICTKCSSVHRQFDTNISKVLSVSLDEWSDDEVDSMIEVGGNSSANSIYEAYLPKGVLKPNADSNNEERTKFIRSKYELQEFLKPSLRIISSKNSFRSCDSGKDIYSGFDSDRSKKTATMVGFMGILKVKVMRGTNLAIRDLLTSDPYVVLTLGQQRAQTTVIRSNLNPNWNEELKLSIPQRYGALKLQVFDYDTFSADDIMGEAEIDLQPMITAAMAFGDVLMLGNMQIGKWLKTSDNALVKDSTINIDDGKVKQEISLKLQNVESGEIELELEWSPIDQ